MNNHSAKIVVNSKHKDSLNIMADWCKIVEREACNQFKVFSSCMEIDGMFSYQIQIVGTTDIKIKHYVNRFKQLGIKGVIRIEVTEEINRK